MSIALKAIVSTVALTIVGIVTTFAILYLVAPWNCASVEQQIGDRFLAANDYRAALMWYRDAAASNNATALYRLGSLYEKGEGVRRDDVEAYKWYKRAIAGSWASAHRDFRDRVEASLASVERRMTVAEIAEADTRADYWRPRKGAPF
jgi:hypothetical protein